MPVWTWGSDVYGRLGQGTEDRHLGRPTQVNPLGIEPLAAVTCGSAHNIVADRNGTVYTWGKCHYGQLGHGEMDKNELVPRRVTELNGVRIKSVGAGDSHVLAVAAEGGGLFSWGVGFYGCLGHGDEASLALPKRVEALQSEEVECASGGAFHSAAVTRSGKLFVWGRNHCMQLGLAPIEMPDYAKGGKTTKLVYLNHKTPVELKLSDACRAVSANNDHTLVLMQSGRVLSFGSNEHGQLGRKSAGAKEPGKGNEGDFLVNPDHFRDKDGKVESVVLVSAGWTHSAAITASGQLYTWGNGQYGELGLGHLRGAAEPRLVESFPDGKRPHFVHVSCGDSFTVAVARDGTAWAFGSGDYGKLGVSGGGSKSVPTSLPASMSGLAGLCCGTNHTIAHTQLAS